MPDSDNIHFAGPSGETPVFAIKDGDLHHTLIIGHSGRGRSVLLEAEAQRLGIPYDELMKRMEPTPEQKEAAKRQEEQLRQKDAERLNAVREAFWANSDPDDSEFYALYDALTFAKIVTEPTSAHIKALFMMLPEDIVGQGIAWGFTDTEVRERVHRFVAENREAVAQRVTVG